MALGRRKAQRQDALWIATDAVAKGPGHPFYARLNGIFAEITLARSSMVSGKTLEAGRPSLT